MVEAYVFVVIATVAMVLYAYDSADILRHAPRGRRVARVCLLVLLSTMPVAYFDIATSGQSHLLWRQWLVGAALTGVAAGYAALLWARRRDH